MIENSDLTENEREEIARNRARYDALKTAGQNSAPLALPAKSKRPAAAPTQVSMDEDIPGGGYRALRLKQGETLRVTTVEGRGSVSLLAWNARTLRTLLSWRHRQNPMDN
jgi:uncharacterized protein